MKRDDDCDKPAEDGGQAGGPARDAKGRWRKGHCPNPKGRPRKPPREDLDLSDLEVFGNTLIDVVSSGEKVTMLRRAALLHKIFESAMKGKVSQQRFLYKEFENNSRRLAAIRNDYERLVIKWIIDNPKFKDPDFEIPFGVDLHIKQLRAILHHYYPTQYSDPKPPEPEDDED